MLHAAANEASKKYLALTQQYNTTMTAATATTISTTNRLARDPSSLSNPDQAHITHLFWDATINFDEQIIIAKATYTIAIVDPSTVKNVRLDTSHLDIHSVFVNDAPATFSLTVPDNSKSHLGSVLEIQLLDNSHSTITITISYTTTNQCSAAQWLPPAQTAGKKHPYIFTQCQAIHARSLLPCQDCPAVKMTYEARVVVPDWATCVMSALSKDSLPSSSSQPSSATTSSNSSSSTNQPNNKNNNNTTTFYFHQPVPIPSYLFALAVGQLSSKDISPRCRVWSEPSMVDAVAYEFAQVEQFLEVAEDLTLEYQWGRYDILCLPPSFPYGGMENPCVSGNIYIHRIVINCFHLLISSCHLFSFYSYESSGAVDICHAHITSRRPISRRRGSPRGSTLLVG